jgi:serine/threonine protein kinase
LLARATPTDRPLVLKWIRPEQAIDGTFIETFVAEGRRASQLHHPNIVEVHEVGREDGTHYLAMEYVHGDDLRKLLARLHERRAKLPVQHILAISTAVAQALEHAHQQTDPDGDPVLHLGIKPGNVIITDHGAVKLADFGIGRAALTEGRTDLLPSIVGYLSPEQCTGQPVDRRSDVFGLGILMYELSVGRRLFKGDNEFVTMATVVAGDIPAPSKHRGDLPKDLEAVIMKALARAPEDRFQSAQELHTALDKFATKAGVRGSLTTLAGYTKRLFGVRPEPWLVDEEPSDVASNDFDGSPKGLAVPPVEAVKSCSLPEFVAATADSPIMRVKKQVSRDLPTEQLNLASLKSASDRTATVPDKSSPVKIPQAANGSTRMAIPKPMPNRPTPVPIAPGRTKPKTVQIPVQVADRIVKEESTKVMVQPPQMDDEPTREKTNVLTAADLSYAGKEEVTKESRSMPAMVDVRAKTVPRSPKPGEEDTIPATPVVAPPIPPKLNGTNGVNGKPALVSLAGLKAADEKREAAKQRKAAEDAARLPKSAVAGEIKQRATSPSRSDTDINVERTSVANPPPMVAATTAARDATQTVKPLPLADKSVTTTDNIIVGSNKKKYFIIAGVAAAALIAIGLAVGFSGGSDPKTTAAVTEEQVAETKPPVVEDKKPEPELRTTNVPRTPRNSHVTTDDPKPEEPKVEEPKVEEPKVEAPKVEAPKVEAPKVEAPKVEEKVEEPKVEEKIAAVPPPVETKVEEKQPVEEKKPKFVEPKDPSPPDEEVKKPAPKPKPKPKAVAAKPKPKPVAAKPKPKTKPATTKPAGKWDPNALFPTTKK